MLSVVPVTEPGTAYVQWQARVKLRWYPWEKLYGIVMDKVAGPGYDTALNGLKDYVEKN